MQRSLRSLAGRGADAGTAGYFESRAANLMPDPSSFKAMDEAATLLADAVEACATVGLFGDYDVDGAASSHSWRAGSKPLGANPIIHIPDRITEGYGPNTQAIDSLIDQGIDLLITLDCGATSHEALAHAKARGLSVLVLDHHQMHDLGPPVDALVNPNRPDDTSGLGHLCAAGVTFMALVAANRELRTRGLEPEALPDLLKLLDLVALATVADVVPLTGLNRAFVVKGLQVAQARGNPGLAALIEVSRLSGPCVLIISVSCWGHASMPAVGLAMPGWVRACSRAMMPKRRAIWRQSSTRSTRNARPSRPKRWKAPSLWLSAITRSRQSSWCVTTAGTKASSD
jgi:single-stranded-DNA-specific exonuclease